MNIVVNGKETAVEQGTTVTALIAQYKLSPKTVIVELRGDVMKREAFDTTVLTPGDTVELVQFVGGG